MNARPDLKLVTLHKPSREPTGLQPYLAHPQKPRAERVSKSRARDFWLIDAAIFLGSGSAIFLILYGVAHKMGAL